MLAIRPRRSAIIVEKENPMVEDSISDSGSNYSASEAERSDISGDEDAAQNVSTPTTTLSAPSPRPLPQCRLKHLPCPYPGCTKSFNRPTRLEEHKRSHTNERIFKCQIPGCQKDFLRDTHLKRHVQSAHTDQKANRCQWQGCDKSFATVQHLKRHHAVHEGHEKNSCKVPGCGEIFRKHATLERHIRTVHQGKQAFPCNEILPDGTRCSQGFQNPHRLKLHKGRDHGAQSYWCTLCKETTEDGEEHDKGFGTYSDLQAHNNEIHPPTCETCGYIARNVRELSHHFTIRHSGEDVSTRQNHICPYPECNGQGFVRKTNLETHIKAIHQGKKPFQCGDPSVPLNNTPGWTNTEGCGRSFATKATLEEHIRTIHLGFDNRVKARQKRLGIWTPPELRPKKRSKTSKLDLLTGTGYQANPMRSIPCTVIGCDFLFVREYDKQVHLQSRHGIPVDDDWMVSSYDDGDDDNNENTNFSEITQLVGTRSLKRKAAPFTIDAPGAEIESSARKGGPFWIGGASDGLGDELAAFGDEFETLLADSPASQREEALPVDPALLK
jgi:general transcription factor IIIA